MGSRDYSAECRYLLQLTSWRAVPALHSIQWQFRHREHMYTLTLRIKTYSLCQLGKTNSFCSLFVPAVVIYVTYTIKYTSLFYLLIYVSFSIVTFSTSFKQLTDFHQLSTKCIIYNENMRNITFVPETK